MSFRSNTLANFGGRLWTAALGALLIPVYVKLLGIEAYALVGISATLQAIFGLLDLGMSAAFNREMARLSAFEGTEDEKRNFLATFDVAYLAMALIIAVLIQLVAPYVATKWVNAQSLDRDTILAGLRLIGIAVALQMPTAFYLGGLLGLERQVMYNVLSIASATVRGFGAIGILLIFGATVRNFFLWQVVVGALTLVAVALTLHSIIDRGQGRGTAQIALVRKVWRYAAGWMSNSVGTNLAGQIDKVVLSRVLPLAQFGYYTLASTAAVLLWNLVYPVTSAAFPRFNRLIATGDEERLRHEYFRANQLIASILIPVSAVIIAFPREVLLLWTGDPVLSTTTDKVMVLFALGMTLAGLANIAQALALCYGWFRLPLTITIAASIVVIPLMIIGGRTYGAVGGAAAWAIQTGAVIALVPLLHRRHLQGEGSRWLTYMVLLPGAAAAAICSLAYLVRPDTQLRVVIAVFLFFTWAAVAAVTAAFEPDVRMAVLNIARRFFSRTVAEGDIK